VRARERLAARRMAGRIGEHALPRDGEVAQEVGQPGAASFVGQAVAPVGVAPILVPRGAAAPATRSYAFETGRVSGRARRFHHTTVSAASVTASWATTLCSVG
jgi:hypothetical protein